MLSFIININYPVGEERVNIHLQTSGFENNFANKNNLGKWIWAASVLSCPGQSCIQRKEPLCITFYGSIFSITHNFLTA